jgi:hypothetical protein
MKTGMILSGLVLILSGSMLSSVASAEERCKVYAESSQAKTESDADKSAWTYGRDACWSYERELGKTTTYNPGSSECVSKEYGNNVVLWTCTYAHVECCYTP